jgi:hypothetical protein
MWFLSRSWIGFDDDSAGGEFQRERRESLREFVFAEVRK